MSSPPSFGEAPRLDSIPRLGRRAVLIIFLVALALRIAAAAAVGFSNLRFGDARGYLSAARTLVTEGRYPDRTDPFHFRAPGYPVFLVAATFGRPDRVALAKLANVLLGSLSPLVLAALSARLFRRRRLAIATGFVGALNPAFVLMSADVQSEALFLLLLLCAGYLLLAATDRPSTSLSLASGGFLAVAALTRPSALVLAPMLAAPFLDRRYPVRVRWHLAASALLGFLFLLAPWTVRNAVVFRQLLPVNDATGYAFYYGNSDWIFRFYGLRTREEYDRWIAEMDRDLQRQVRELDGAGRRSPAERSRYFFRKALSERAEDPVRWAGLFLRKTWDWLRPYPRPWYWPRWVVIGVGAFYAVLTVFAAAGLLAAQRRGVALFALAVLVISMGAHVALMVVWRYRMPYWDPILLLYGTQGAADTLTGRWRARS
ncbi:MAG: glycosyltransferase family 39 protein [Thermoanaerobaculia bacterium]